MTAEVSASNGSILARAGAETGPSHDAIERVLGLNRGIDTRRPMGRGPRESAGRFVPRSFRLSPKPTRTTEFLRRPLPPSASNAAGSSQGRRHD
jgi:hypothetical protein